MAESDSLIAEIEKLNREIEDCENVSIEQHGEIHYWRDKARDYKLQLESIKAKRDAFLNLLEDYRWIPVQERLPEDMLPSDSKARQIKVLVSIRGENGTTVRTQLRMKPTPYFQSIGITDWYWKYAAGNVTHWMPLPEPPKERLI